MTGELLKPPVLTNEELQLKMNHLREILAASDYNGICLQAEGALRWLTGLRHELAGIAPDASSPVYAIVSFSDGAPKIDFITTEFEKYRLDREIDMIWGPAEGPDYRIMEQPPVTADGILFPGQPDYTGLLKKITGTFLGGESGAQRKKFQWLAVSVRRALVRAVRNISPGDSVWKLRAAAVFELEKQGIECNLLLAAAEGQEFFPHPVVNGDYRVPASGLIKVAAGGRYSEMICSTTVSAVIGRAVSDREQHLEKALQEAALQYALSYRTGEDFAIIAENVGDIFREVGEKTSLADLAESAYFHHLGGPMGPLGNREMIIDSSTPGRVEADYLFGVNPVHRGMGLKIEIQGITSSDPGKPPVIVDDLSEGLPFTEFDSGSDRKIRLASLLEI